MNRRYGFSQFVMVAPPVAIKEGVAASGSALFLQPIHEKMIVMAKTSGGFELSNQWTRRLIPMSLTDKASKLRN